MSKIRMDEWPRSNGRAIAFIRVSTKKQVETVSFDTQEAEVRDYCKKNNLELVEVVKIAESAKDSMRRDLYHEAVRNSFKKKLVHHLYYMSDREARNMTDVETNEAYVRAGKIVVHYVRDKKVLHQGSSESDFLMRDFNSVINKNFSRQIAAKVKDAMAQKAEQGWYPSNRPPLGYKTHRQSRRSKAVIVPDPNEQNINQVRREFQLKASGYSYQQIADIIKIEGFKNTCYASAIEKRIKNPFYGGSFYWEGHLYKGNHELIIDNSTYLKVLDSIGVRGTKAQKEHPLAHGFLKCKSCGCYITYDPKIKKNKKTGLERTYHYFRCSNGKRAHSSLKSVKEDLIWTGLEIALDTITIPDSFALQLSEALNESVLKSQQSFKRRLDELNAERSRYEEDEDNLMDHLLKKVVDEESYKKQLLKIRANKERICTQIKVSQEQSQSVMLETAQSTIELARDAKLLWKHMTGEERVELLEIVLSNRELDGVNVCFEIKKPFKLLSKMKGSNYWYSHGDSNPSYRREKAMS